MSQGAASVYLADAAATEALAARMASSLPARALLRRLGVGGTIRSPTYTLVERYPVPGGEAAHLDLYRLGDAAELDFLALDELAEAARLWLVEWPGRGAGHLPPADLVLRLAVEGAGRRALLSPLTASGRAWVDAVLREAVPGSDDRT